jgi:hypothetical protein
MAKKKKNNDPVVLDGMPGADPIAAEEKEPFQVDLNFETEEEVEFPKEGEVEEIEESELTTTPEELEQKAEEEVEEEGDTAGEDTSEETVDAVDDDATQPVVQPDAEPVAQEEVVEEVKKPMVPKSRLDEVLAKQKALQKQLDEANKAQQVQKDAPTYDFALKEQEYQQLVLDGETQKAVELRNEIRDAEKAQFMFEVEQKMGQNIQQNQELNELQAKAAEIEAKYPILSENDANFDLDLQNEVIGLRDAFIAQGYVPVDALEKATEYTLAAKKPELLAPSKAPAPAPVAEKAQEAKQKANVTKKLEAAESQPPQMTGQSDAKKQKTIDINTLSEKEFNALPAETLRRLRGDFS